MQETDLGTPAFQDKQSKVRQPTQAEEGSAAALAADPVEEDLAGEEEAAEVAADLRSAVALSEGLRGLTH
jgi:hypothetical protein